MVDLSQLRVRYTVPKEGLPPALAGEDLVIDQVHVTVHERDKYRDPVSSHFRNLLCPDHGDLVIDPGLLETALHNNPV